MDQRKNYITPIGFEKLRSEYHELLHKERPKVVETVAWAAGNGDRSENADYQYGKKRLREIDSRLRFLLNRIERAEVVDPQLQSGSIVRFGAVVIYEDEDGVQHQIQIVGEDEIDLEKMKISWNSPMAKALLGKKTGDEVEVQKPHGKEFVQILEVLWG